MTKLQTIGQLHESDRLRDRLQLMQNGDAMSVHVRLPLAIGLVVVTVGTTVTTAAAPKTVWPVGAQTVGAERQDTRAREAYARALALETSGNDGAAITLLWEAAGLAPRDADIQNHLGEALERLGALDAAADAYQQALAVRPDFRKATNHLILVLVKAGRGPEAIDRARALVASAPADPEALFTLGLAQSEQDVTEAIATFRRVLAMAPRHALAHYNLALALRRLDRLPDAIEELDRVIAIEPRPQAYYQLGVIYLHLGELPRAARALREAIRLDARDADAYSTLGAVLTAQGDRPGAAAALRQAIAVRPDLWTARYALATVLQRSGDDAGARKETMEGDRLRQQAAAAQEGSSLTAVGIARLAAGDLAGARDVLQRATGVCPSCGPAHYQLGLVLRRLGLRDAARAAFVRARQLNPALVPPPDYH